MVGCTREQYSISATRIVRGLSYTTLSLLSFTGLLSLIAILSIFATRIAKIQVRREDASG